MSRATNIYRNPDAPVGYTLPVKPKVNDDDHNNNIAYLMKVLENFVSDSDSDADIDQFLIATSEESADEDTQNDAAETRKSPIIKEETGTKQNDAATSSSSSRVVSPVKSEKSTRETKSDKLPAKSKTSAERKERRDSESSSDSHYYSRSRTRRISRSPSPVRIKQEHEVPEHLFGCYHCDVCNLTLNSKATYNAHIIGKRHQKACNKAMNIVDTAARSVPNTEVESKYPIAASGIVRTKVDKTSYIQPLVDAIRIPIPGLHNVIEIRAFSETSYYCSLCNAPCSGNSILPHLKGFKHTLKCLKLFRPEIYEQISYKQKYQIEDRIKKILMSIEEREGRGKITVEEEKLSVEATGNESGPSMDICPQPSTSRGEYFMDFNEYYEQTIIPDTSKSGYYCKLCESHMNSLEMWQNHIGGKRHLTNARKMPGSLPSKMKKLPVKNAKANLMMLLENVHTPVVGLNHIRETQNRQTQKDMYQCYLCGACLNTNDIVDHVTSHKHRVKYLQEINHSCLDVVKDMDINGSNAIAIVEHACAQDEEKYGRGKPHVFLSKDFFPPTL